jgi:hypothetical protein
MLPSASRLFCCALGDAPVALWFRRERGGDRGAVGVRFWDIAFFSPLTFSRKTLVSDSENPEKLGQHPRGDALA